MSEGHGDGCVCSECGYEPADYGEAASFGEGCSVCGQGSMISMDDFVDKWGMEPAT